MKELPVVPQRYAPVRTLIVYLTEACNLRCSYCFVKKSPRTMSSSTVRKTIDFFLHRNTSGVEKGLNLSFFGGEPFLELELLEEALDYALCEGRRHRKSFDFAATTNATIATPEVERLLRTHGLSLLVSFDGTEHAMDYRPFLGGGSPYRAVARNLERLVSWAPQVVVRLTYHPNSLALRAQAERALELGAPTVAMCAVHESDWRGHLTQLEEAFEEVADWFISEALKGRFLPLEITWQQLRGLHAAEVGGERPSRPCEVGAGLISVDPDGAIMPCHRYLYRPKDWLGEVLSPPETLPRTQYLNLSSRQILGCADCPAEPFCGGGCRYLTVAEGGDLESGRHRGYCSVTQAEARASRRIYSTLMNAIPETFLSALQRSRPLSLAFGELTP